MNSGEGIGDARKKSLISQHAKRAPWLESEITLFISTFVSSNVIVGDPESGVYSNQSPPTTSRMRHGSALSGLWSHTKFA